MGNIFGQISTGPIDLFVYGLVVLKWLFMNESLQMV